MLEAISEKVERGFLRETERGDGRGGAELAVFVISLLDIRNIFKVEFNQKCAGSASGRKGGVYPDKRLSWRQKVKWVWSEGMHREIRERHRSCVRMKNEVSK